MAKKISKAFRKRDDHVTPVRVLNVWLPWNAEEEQMQIDLDGANLVDIWEKIGEELNEPPCWMTLDRCRELINRMQGWEMSKSCWDKRIERAINAASERTTTEQWEQFIAPFVRRKGKSN